MHLELRDVCLVSDPGHELSSILHLVRRGEVNTERFSRRPPMASFSPVPSYRNIPHYLFLTVVIPLTLDAVGHSGLASFMSTGHTVGSLDRREPRLRNCLCRIGLQANP